MAEIYIIMGDNDQAIKWLEKAVETDETIYKLIDSYECYAPLRKEKKYCKLIGIGTIEEEYPTSKKGFYMLEMFVEPGGLRESFKLLSGDKEKINQAVLSRLKASVGLYALLIYGITIRVHSYCEGKLQNTVNLLPYIKVELPHMKPINGSLTAEFQADNLPLMKNEAGELVTKELLASFLSNYEYQPLVDKIYLDDWESEAGKLEGEVAAYEESINCNGNEWMTDIVYEEESGEEFTFNEYIQIMEGE